MAVLNLSNQIAMKSVFTTLTFCFYCCFLFGQKDLQFVKLDKSITCIAIKKDSTTTDSIFFGGLSVNKIDYFVASDATICLLIEDEHGMIMYNKYIRNMQDKIFALSTCYIVGYYPLQSAYVPHQPKKPIYKIVGEDKIESMVDGKTSLVDLEKLEKLGFGGLVSPPK